MSNHLLKKLYNGHMLYRNLPDPPQIWHISGKTSRGGTVIPSKTTGVNGDIISLSYELNPECQFYAYTITGATLTGNQFMIDNSDVTASMSYYDRLAMTGKFCDKLVPHRGAAPTNTSHFYVTTDGIERINETVGYATVALKSYGAYASNPGNAASYEHQSINSLNFNTARQVIFSASITAEFNNPTGEWAGDQHTFTARPATGYIGLYGVDSYGNTLTLGTKTVNMSNAGNYTAILDASAYITNPSAASAGSGWGATHKWSYILSARADMAGVSATPIATTGIWKIINKKV